MKDYLDGDVTRNERRSMDSATISLLDRAGLDKAKVAGIIRRGIEGADDGAHIECPDGGERCGPGDRQCDGPQEQGVSHRARGNVGLGWDASKARRIPDSASSDARPAEPAARRRRGRRPARSSGARGETLR